MEPHGAGRGRDRVIIRVASGNFSPRGPATPRSTPPVSPGCGPNAARAARGSVFRVGYRGEQRTVTQMPTTPRNGNQSGNRPATPRSPSSGTNIELSNIGTTGRGRSSGTASPARRGSQASPGHVRSLIDAINNRKKQAAPEILRTGKIPVFGKASTPKIINKRQAYQKFVKSRIDTIKELAAERDLIIMAPKLYIAQLDLRELGKGCELIERKEETAIPVINAIKLAEQQLDRLLPLKLSALERQLQLTEIRKGKNKSDEFAMIVATLAEIENAIKQACDYIRYGTDILMAEEPNDRLAKELSAAAMQLVANVKILAGDTPVSLHRVDFTKILADFDARIESGLALQSTIIGRVNPMHMRSPAIAGQAGIRAAALPGTPVRPLNVINLRQSGAPAGFSVRPSSVRSVSASLPRTPSSGGLSITSGDAGLAAFALVGAGESQRRSARSISPSVSSVVASSQLQLQRNIFARRRLSAPAETLPESIPLPASLNSHLFTVPPVSSKLQQNVRAAQIRRYWYLLIFLCAVIAGAAIAGFAQGMLALIKALPVSGNYLPSVSSSPTSSLSSSPSSTLSSSQTSELTSLPNGASFSPISVSFSSTAAASSQGMVSGSSTAIATWSVIPSESDTAAATSAAATSAAATSAAATSPAATSAAATSAAATSAAATSAAATSAAATSAAATSAAATSAAATSAAATSAAATSAAATSAAATSPAAASVSGTPDALLVVPINRGTTVLFNWSNLTPGITGVTEICITPVAGATVQWLVNSAVQPDGVPFCITEPQVSGGQVRIFSSAAGMVDHQAKYVASANQTFILETSSSRRLLRDDNALILDVERIAEVTFVWTVATPLHRHYLRRGCQQNSSEHTLMR